jgi:hypothetical protein
MMHGSAKYHKPRLKDEKVQTLTNNVNDKKKRILGKSICLKSL